MSAAGHGFSALNTGLQPPSSPLIATVEVHPEPPSDNAFPDPTTWAIESTTPDAPDVRIKDSDQGDDSNDSKDADRGDDKTESSGATGADSTETPRKLIPAEAPSVAGTGYTCGKWLWEWQVVSCGNRASIGVCGHDVAAISATGIPVQGGGASGGGGSGGSEGSGSGGGGGGDDDERAELWMYHSDGHLSHGGESTERVCPGGGFDGGDVIGVELDLDAGTVAFLKNDSYVGGQFTIVRRSDAAKKDGTGGASGLYPCVSLHGSGDALVLLGLKEGAGSISYRPPSKDGDRGESGRNSPSPPPPPPSSSEGGIAAALSAAVAAAAEAVTAAAAISVGGGDVAALAAAEAAAAEAAAAAVAEGTRDRTTGDGTGCDAEQDAGGPAAVIEDSAVVETAPTGASDAGGSSDATDSSAGTGESDASGTHTTRDTAIPAAAAGVEPSPPNVVPQSPPPSSRPFPPASFHGEFVRGLKHGPGTLRLMGKGGFWRGRWFQGVQHGVHLLVEPSAKGQAEEDGTPTAWVFDRGVKVCAVSFLF